MARGAGSSRALWTLGAWLSVGASVAQAHAPIPRRLALSADGGSAALSLPGFGLVVRGSSEQGFAYACDGLLGLKPSDRTPALSFLRDGSLLLGSIDGVRRLTRDGCPEAGAGGELAAAAVVALAVQRGPSETAYAVASGAHAGVWRSQDGGKHWELRAPLAQSEYTTALVTPRADANRVYASVQGPDGPPVLVASSDGGATLTTLPQALPLILLSADAPAPTPLWAMTRDAMTVGNRGIALLRAPGPEGPWQPALRVNYFGGFSVDAQGVIWVGDELGGVSRSDNGGDSFRNVEPDADAVCVETAGDALWACRTGTPDQPVLQRLQPGQARVNVLALAAVDRLVTCPGLDVAKSCAVAWSEWQRDVRMIAPPADADAGAGAPPELTDAGALAEPDAFDLPAPPVSARTESARCTLRTDASRSTRMPGGCPGAALALALGALRVRRRRRVHALTVPRERSRDSGAA